MRGSEKRRKRNGSWTYFVKGKKLFAKYRADLSPERIEKIKIYLRKAIELSLWQPHYYLGSLWHCQIFRRNHYILQFYCRVLGERRGIRKPKRGLNSAPSVISAVINWVFRLCLTPIQKTCRTRFHGLT